MNIVVEFSISPRFLEGIDHEVKAVFENVPYVPEESMGLWVKWEDFYDEETADKIYSSLRNNFLTARKLMERFEKDRIFVQFEYFPYLSENDDDSDDDSIDIPYFEGMN